MKETASRIQHERALLMPSAWPTVKLQEVCTRITDGTHQSPKFVASGVPFLVISNVISGAIDWATVTKWVDEATYEANTARCRPERGDVLYTAVGSFGVAIPVETDRRFMFQRHIAHIKPDLTRVHTRFLAHMLNSPTMRAVAERVAKGVAQRTVTLADLKGYDVPLPPLPEQRRIADILDKADAIRRKRKEAIALTEQLLRSAFLEMFGDPVTNPKGWEVKPLGDLLEFLTSGSRGWAEYYSESGDLFLRIQNVRSDCLDLRDVAFVRAPNTAEARRTLTYPGDVLLSITADLGRTAVVTPSVGRAFINQHLAILRPSVVESEYLSAFLASEGGQRQFRRLNKGGVKAGLNFDDIRSVQVMLPTRAHQQAFAAFKAKARSSRGRQSELASRVASLFAALVQRAFSGELGDRSGPDRAQLDLFKSVKA